METKACEYSFTKEQLKSFMGAVLLPHEIRVQVLERHRKNFGTAGLVDLFSQFIGLANSVVANHRQWMEEYLIIEHHEYPHAADKINTPTIYGALHGAEIAVPPTPAMCNTCAFRQGTIANQSPSTTSDAHDCVTDVTDSPIDATKFMCHEGVTEDETHTRTCAGYARERGRILRSENVLMQFPTEAK